MRSSRMPIVGILTGSTALAAAIALALAGTALPANAATVNYVALGDSYSSGVGAGSYYSSSGSCDRSPNAYPENLMPHIYAAVKAYATLGEICDAMRAVFGTYEETAIT